MTAPAIAAEPPTGQWRERVQACLRAVEELAEHPPALETAADLEALERECARRCDALLAHVVGAVTQSALDSAALKAQAQALAKSTSKRLKPAGVRPVSVQFQRGPSVSLSSLYFRRRKGNIHHRE